MKTIKIEKNKLFLKHELSNKTCSDILTNNQTQIRFDLVFEDDSTDQVFKTLRATIELDNSGCPSLVIKDYEGHKFRQKLKDEMTLSDVTLLGLHYAWNL